jgi:hypothetical protein
MTTLYGRDAKPPYPAIEGLVAQHIHTQAAIADLGDRVEALDRGLDEVKEQVDELISRTEPNGGGSMKDQLNRIVELLENRDG